MGDKRYCKHGRRIQTKSKGRRMFGPTLNLDTFCARCAGELKANPGLEMNKDGERKKVEIAMLAYRQRRRRELKTQMREITLQLASQLPVNAYPWPR
jgi:hypothetical protein